MYRFNWNWGYSSRTFDKSKFTLKPFQCFVLILQSVCSSVNDLICMKIREWSLSPKGHVNPNCQGKNGIYYIEHTCVFLD